MPTLSSRASPKIGKAQQGNIIAAPAAGSEGEIDPASGGVAAIIAKQKLRATFIAQRALNW